jgi:hypothetical protein
MAAAGTAAAASRAPEQPRTALCRATHAAEQLRSAHAGQRYRAADAQHIWQ